MASRTLWKGSISFGLVSIPVGLYTVDNSAGLDLDMLDKRNNARVHFKRVNADTGREVPWKQIVKGYRYSGNKYVIITDEDFKKANVKATQTIDIEHFVALEEVEPRYFEKPYQIMPTKGGEKPYALLRDSLKKKKKIAIAKIVIRTKQHLAAIMPEDDHLILEILRFQHEIRDLKDLKVPKPPTAVSARELKMASDLIDAMSDKWDPDSYKDTYYEDVKKMIAYKVKHGESKEVEVPEDESAPSTGKVLDLMPLLRESLAGKRPSKRAKSSKKTAKKSRSKKKA